MAGSLEGSSIFGGVCLGSFDLDVSYRGLFAGLDESCLTGGVRDYYGK